MRKILAPHKEQDGWVYVRVRKVGEPFRSTTVMGRRVSAILFQTAWDVSMRVHCIYHDTDRFRIISSRKTEEAVETWEYLKRCEDEGIQVTRWADEYRNGKRYPILESRRWTVNGDGRHGDFFNGATLREAYHRYKATV